MEEGNASPFGERLTDVACRATIPPQAEAEALAEIWTEGLLLKPRQGQTLFIPYTEITKIEPANYRIHVVTASSEMTLSALGIKYEPFAQRLLDAMGDALVKALLMQEPLKVYEARATYVHTRGDRQYSGMCRARIYPTGIVVLPVNALPFKVPFSSISSVEVEGYRVRILTPKMGMTEFSRMGNATQFFADALSEAQRNLEGETIKAIKEMMPSIGYEDVQALNKLMYEGRAAMRKSVEAVSEGLWGLLEAKVNDSALSETYRYLSSLGARDYTAIGLKKAMQGIYVWFLVPISGSVEKGGNSLVMEVTSETGHATYLFRVMGRKEFPLATPEVFLSEAEENMKALNEGMIATGFRREPIYLSEDKLSTPAYSKYLYAAKNLDVLRALRERFYARIIHTTHENWLKDLTEAMAFNTKTLQDEVRWSKSQLDQPEE